MRKVAIIGIGQTPVREHWDYPIRYLGVQALLAAMQDARVDTIGGLFVGNMLSGALSEQEHLGALIADYAGFSGIEAVKVEAACASGAAAMRMALMAVASGRMEVAAAVGVEKLTEFSGKFSTAALATAADADYEASIGLSFAAINALMMRRYMHEYKVNKEDFAIFPIIAHANAVHNPNAMFHHTINREDYARAKMIADPINLMDSSPIADGAAAVIIVPMDKIKKYAGKAVRVAACELATDTVGLDSREDALVLKGVQKSASKALKIAGIEAKQIQLMELHDAFSIMSVLSLENSGFCQPGRALFAANDGKYSIDGEMPVCTFGGLKGRGHPVGASGLYQIVEAVQQVRGDAPAPIQVEDVEWAMAQNIGGSGATVITSILNRINE